MAIADVESVGVRHHPFCRPGLAGNDQIIGLKVKIQKGVGHKGHVKLVQFPREGKFIDIRCMYPVGIYKGRNGPGIVYMGIDIGPGVHFQQGFQHLFPAPHIDKPIVNNSDFHIRPRLFPAE
jgi:hypothetical protein